MIRIIKSVLAVVGVAFSGYLLISDNYELIPVMMFILGTLLMVCGVDEFQKGRRGYGYMNVVVGLFVYSVFVKGLFLV